MLQCGSLEEQLGLFPLVVDNSALYKSSDAGKTWNKIHNGFPDGQLGRLAIAVAPSDATYFIYSN